MTSERGGHEEEPPLVSVVIPVYNCEAFFDETLRSARAQTLRDIEIIVIDDGSTDGSMSIAERHASADQRIRLFRQPNSGVASAQNHGVREARAPWIALLGADDVALPQRLERQLAYLSAHPRTKVLGTYGWRIGARGRELGAFDVGPRDQAHFERLRSANEAIYLLASSVVFSRDVALAAGGFRELDVAEDVDLWTRIADYHLVEALPERLVLYRVHTASMSSAALFRQLEAALWISAASARRRAGLPELTRDEFHSLLKSEPLHRRVRRHLRWTSQYCYRIAGGLLADRRARGFLWLLASFLVWPPVPVWRLKQQMVPWLTARIGSRRH